MLASFEDDLQIKIRLDLSYECVNTHIDTENHNSEEKKLKIMYNLQMKKLNKKN